jgi:hypothetical protein
MTPNSFESRAKNVILIKNDDFLASSELAYQEPKFRFANPHAQNVWRLLFSFQRLTGWHLLALRLFAARCRRR